MRIIEPKVEILSNPITMEERYAHIAKCARVCYRSNKTTNNERFVNGLIDSGHISMLRHDSYYYIIDNIDDIDMLVLNPYMKSPFLNINQVGNTMFISTNGNFIYDNHELALMLSKYEVDYNNFVVFKSGFDIARYTFIVTTQISTSRELNRVSPNNISEQSTRYVYEDGTICRPHWLQNYDIYLGTYGRIEVYINGKKDNDINHKTLTYVMACQNNFNAYNYLVKADLPREDARGVLPIDTATICVYTYSIPEWRHIIDLRYYGTTGRPHPNAVIIAGMIRKELIELGYEFR